MQLSAVEVLQCSYCIYTFICNYCIYTFTCQKGREWHE